MAAVQLGRFMKTYRSYTDGQVEVLEVDEDESSFVIAKLSPNEGPYKGASLRFKIFLDSRSPKAMDTFLHPNISNDRSVCLEHDGESEDTSTEQTLLALLFILHQPNYDDPYGHWKHRDEKQAYRAIRVALSGRAVDDYPVYERYIEDDGEILQFVDDLKYADILAMIEEEIMAEHEQWQRVEREQDGIRIEMEMVQIRAWQAEQDRLQKIIDDEIILEHHVWVSKEWGENWCRVENEERAWLAAWRQEQWYLEKVKREACEADYGAWVKAEEREVMLRIQAEADWLEKWRLENMKARWPALDITWPAEEQAIASNVQFTHATKNWTFNVASTSAEKRKRTPISANRRLRSTTSHRPFLKATYTRR